MKRGMSWEMLISIILLIIMIVLVTLYFIPPLKKGASIASTSLTQQFCPTTQKTPEFYINEIEEAIKTKNKDLANKQFEEMKRCFPNLRLPILEEDLKQA